MRFFRVGAQVALTAIHLSIRAEEALKSNEIEMFDI